jgi:hypothetical protein
MPSDVLVIAAQNLMPSLRERVEVDGECLEFADTEPIQALQAIIEHRPTLIVLERLFAATPRGAALINRIKSDPQLSVCEVRVMSHTGDYSRQVVKPAAVEAAAATATHNPSPSQPAGSVATEEAPRSLDWHGTRRAPRYRVREGVEMQLDGNPALVVDLSAFGAQVTSSTVLRPNQKVRISLPGDEFVMRFRGSIAWAKFELPRATDTGPQYRAGVEFTDSDPAAIEGFCDRNKKDKDKE